MSANTFFKHRFFKHGLLTLMTGLLTFSAFSVFAQTTPSAATTLAPNSSGVHIQHWQTSKGIPVYFVRAPELPMMDVEVMFRAGSARDGSQYGLAQLTNGLLNEGAGKLTADQIAEQFDSVGAIYNSDVNRDMATVNLRSLTDPQYLNPALQTFTTVLTSPTFSAEAFTQIQNQLLTVLQQESQTPGQIAAKALAAQLFANHPYGHTTNGDADTLKKMTPENVRHFYQQYYVAKNAVIALVGNLTQEQAQQIAEQITQALPVGEAAPAIALAADTQQSSRQNIRFPSQQTTVILGQVAIAPKDPDYFPLLVGNYILGSDTLSRLFKQVREERGWAYQVASQFSPLQARGAFLVFLQSRNAEANQALELSQKILQDFIEGGPTASELNYAQQHLTGAFPLSIASNSNILNLISYIGFYGLPLDYLDTYRSRVSAVTVEQVKRAWQQRVHPKTMAIVTVGPA